MKDLLDILIAMEERLILIKIEENFFSKGEQIHQVSTENMSLINDNLLFTNSTNLAFKAHNEFIDALISIYIKKNHHNKWFQLKLIFNFFEIDGLEKCVKGRIELLPKIVELLHITFLNSIFLVEKGSLSRKISKHHLREIGAVYTLKDITHEIVDNCISNSIKQGSKVNELKCLDFASGTGRFYFEAVEILINKYKLNIYEIITRHLYAIDVDQTALTSLRFNVISYFHDIPLGVINSLSTNIIHRNALVPNIGLLHEDSININLSIDFKEPLLNGGFDTVFSNPPYFLLKVNKKQGIKGLGGYYEELSNKVKKEVHFFRNSGFYNHSIEGMLNYYQLSIEMIIKLTKKNGQIGVICPSSIFADKTSTKLRKHLLTDHKLQFIRYYPESANLFDNVSQSTVIFYFQKSGKTSDIEINIADEIFQINIETISSIFLKSMEIPLIDKMGWSILSKISNYRKLKDMSFIRNRRGELDLTNYKDQITDKNTGWRLVRGNMISEEGIINKNNEYVDIDNFINKKSDSFKNNDFNKIRLVCQQISNIDLKKRMKFTFCKETDIIGNSCNYIISTRKSDDLHKLKYIFNSSLLNWRFKITSSNNHINNYELDELPIIDLDNIKIDGFSSNIEENDEIIFNLYGLTKDESVYIKQYGIKRENIYYE